MTYQEWEETEARRAADADELAGADYWAALAAGDTDGLGNCYSDADPGL